MIEKMQTDGYIVINMEERIDSPMFEMTKSVKSPDASSPPKMSKARHRASVACSTCRDRRIRCVVPANAKECIQCKRSGVDCIIKNDDERRRPISRAYVCSLTDRIALLEAMLKEQGVEVPPANHPPKNRQPPRGESSTSRRMSKIHRRMENQRSPDDSIKSEHSDDENASYQGEAESPASLTIQTPENDAVVGDSTAENDMEVHKPTTVPARRRSADESVDQPNKKKQAGRTRANTEGSKPRSMIMVTSASNANLAPEMQPDSLRQTSTGHADDLTTTPGCEVPIWQPFLEPAPNLDFGFATPSSTNHSTPGPSTAWMRAERETSNSMSLVEPDYLTFSALEQTQHVNQLEFLSLGHGADNWEKAWAGMGFASELDGFASQRFDMGFGGWMGKVGV